MCRCGLVSIRRPPGSRALCCYIQVFRLPWQRGYQWGAQVTGLDSIDHVVLVMLENRSFDHMLGFLYPKSGDFEGLDGTESNADAAGNAVRVFPITADMQNAYYFPLANPAEMTVHATTDVALGAVLVRLRAVPDYVERFKLVFGTANFTIDHVSRAIAAFERTVLSGGVRDI